VEPNRRRRAQIQKSVLISRRCRGAVTVYGAVEHDGEACLVMKLYEGTLADKLAQVGKLSTRDAIRYGEQVRMAAAVS
jgi:hypothetical protein